MQKRSGENVVALNTVKAYMDHLSDSFLFTECKRWDVKGKSYFDYPNKYYCEDIGLRNARIGFRQQEMTHIMENIIFNELMIRECSGIVCVCLRDEDCKRLELPQMVASNSNTQGTAFTVSIEAAHGCTTGVSAKDRVTTIKAAANPNGKPEDLLRPGHVYPLRARSGGVLERRGHTETTVDLMRIAGLNPCGVLCELMNEDGTMARLPEALAFAKKHDLPIITVEDLVKYRREKNV